jgi:hypothetical protein
VQPNSGNRRDRRDGIGIRVGDGRDRRDGIRVLPRHARSVSCDGARRSGGRKRNGAIPREARGFGASRTLRRHWAFLVSSRICCTRPGLSPTASATRRRGSPASLAWTIATLRRRQASSRATATRRSCSSCPGTYKILNGVNGIGGRSRPAPAPITREARFARLGRTDDAARGSNKGRRSAGAVVALNSSRRTSARHSRRRVPRHSASERFASRRHPCWTSRP